MDKTEVNRTKQNGPERVDVGGVKAKKMKPASIFYENTSYPLINMEIGTLMGGMIDVTKMCANMFMPIG